MKVSEKRDDIVSHLISMGRESLSRTVVPFHRRTCRIKPEAASAVCTSETVEQEVLVGILSRLILPLVSFILQFLH